MGPAPLLHHGTTMRSTTRTVMVCAVLAFLAVLPALQAQPNKAREDALSQQEIDQLRDSAFLPTERLRVFTEILNSREKRLEDLLARRRHHTDFPADMHDVLEQFGTITDELNDNLDDYNRRHRDVRKALPKLIEATERWSTALRTAEENDAYNVVRRIALDDVRDTKALAGSLRTDLDAYFKAHPEADALEKKQAADPHAVRGGDGPPER